MYFEKIDGCNNGLLIVIFIGICLNSIFGNDNAVNTVADKNEYINGAYRNGMLRYVGKGSIQDVVCKDFSQKKQLNSNPNCSTKITKINRTIYREMGNLRDRNVLSSDFIEKRRVFEKPSEIHSLVRCKQNFITPFGNRDFYKEKSIIPADSTSRQNRNFDPKDEEYIPQENKNTNNQCDKPTIVTKPKNEVLATFSPEITKDEINTKVKTETKKAENEKTVKKKREQRENEYDNFIKSLKQHMQVFFKETYSEKKDLERLKHEAKEDNA